MIRVALNSVGIAVLLAAIVSLVGCQKTDRKTENGTTSQQPAHQTGGETEEVKSENPDFPPFHSHTVGRKGGVIAVLGRHQFHAEFLPDIETGDISVLLYDDHFMPVEMNAKELTLNIMVGGEPKQYTFLVDHPGSDQTVAVYKLSDSDLAKLLKAGWEGNAQVSVTEKDSPVSGRLAQPEKAQ